MGTFPQVFGQVKEFLKLGLHKIIRVSHVVACSIVFILFYEQSWQGEVFKVMKNDHFFSAFRRLGPFPQDFGQLKGRVIFEQHKIKYPHVVKCPIVLILFEVYL